MTDPLAPLRVVSVQDPALDMTPAQFVDYYRSGFDEALLRLKPGTRPRFFEVRRLGYKRLHGLRMIRSEADRQLLAFRSACFEVAEPDGATLRPAGDLADIGLGEKVAPEEWVETVAAVAGMDPLYEVGSVAEQWAALPKGARGPFVFRVG